MLGFERFELLQQRVELGVGDLGIVVDVVALFVVTDRVTQLAEAFFVRKAPYRGYRSRDRT